MRKIIIGISFLICGLAFTQENAPENWFTLDPVKDLTQGVSADLVHEMMKGRESRTVIVAVIDSGVDIEHEDLQGKIWKNNDEIANNGIDDDENGYIDDVNGWNFIGGSNGDHVKADTYELTREYARLLPLYGDMSKSPKGKEEEFKYWLDVKRKFNNRASKAIQQYDFYSSIRDNTVRYHELLLAYLDTTKLSLETLRKIQSEDETIAKARDNMIFIFSQLGDEDFSVLVDQLNEAANHYEIPAKYGYNIEFNSREIVGDNWEDPYEIGYGNPDVKGPSGKHGTHVSGIIAAIRDNELGIRGIAENVLIMPIRAVPNGDERDKDVANAIRYAVDNGADIINMSFGKAFSRRKFLVDEAIRYAIENNVLMIHAAGNSKKNLDKENNFPTPKLSEDERATHWLEVGATSWGDDENFVANFSNYGKTSVDLFAPGVELYSTTPNNGYESMNGTSFSAPTASGVAAVVMSYFPELSAEQVREVLLNSSRKFGDLKVIKPGGNQKVQFSELSISGGLVNAMEAVKMAEQMSKEFAANR